MGKNCPLRLLLLYSNPLTLALTRETLPVPSDVSRERHVSYALFQRTHKGK